MEQMALTLARLGRAAGHEDRIVLFDAGMQTAGAVFEAGVPVTALHRRPGVDLQLVRRLRHELASRGPTLLHAHNDTALVYAALAGAAPRIVTFHNAPVHATRGARWLARLAGLRSAARVTVSRELGNLLTTTGWLGRFTVVCNGVPGPLDAVNHPAHSGLRVLFVGRLVAGKRVSDIVAAVRALPEHLAVRLTILGDGPARAELTAAAANHPGITLLGAIQDPARVREQFRAHDAFVIASDHEGCPLALLEAMAEGLAIVGTAVGGLPEVLGGQDQGCAILVPPRNPCAIAAALEQFARCPGLREVVGVRAHERWRQHFTAAAMYEHYDSTYRAACQRGQPASPAQQAP